MFSRLLPIVALVAACSSVTEAQLPPPPSSFDVELSADPWVVAGQTFDVSVTGDPGASFGIVLGAPNGQSACPGVLAPVCLDVSAPISILHTGTLGASGSRTVQLAVPRAASGPVRLQAVTRQAGVVLTSNVASVRAFPDVDTDGDGLVDGLELFVHGTDIFNADSDGDTIDDATEIRFGGDPLNPDSDNDGLDDNVELQLGTNPISWDTDGGGSSDGNEVTSGSDPLDPSDDTPGCVAGISEVLPGQGDTNHFVRDNLEIRFNQDSASTAVVTLTDSAGNILPSVSTSESSGRVMIVDPVDDLPGNELVTMTIEYDCSSVAEIRFTTGPDILPVPAASLVGTTYEVDLGTGRVYDPPGIGGLLSPLLADAGAGYAIEILGVSGPDTLDAAVHRLDDVGRLSQQQDLCFPTRFITVDYDGSTFSFDGVFLEPDVNGVDWPIAVQFQGTLVGGGSALAGSEAVVEIPQDLLNTMDLGLDLGSQSVCDLVAGFGVSCAPCTVATGLCLATAADYLTVVTNANAAYIDTTPNLGTCTEITSCASGCQSGSGPWPGFGALLGALLLLRRRS